MIPGFSPGSIRFDEHGRASLTDMHRIAGGENRNQPAEWLKAKGTRSLVARFSEKSNSRFEAGAGLEAKLWDNPIFSEPIRVIRGGRFPGTWAAPEIAREYAFFLAPRFHPWREWQDRPDIIERLLDRRFWPAWPSAPEGSSEPLNIR